MIGSCAAIDTCVIDALHDSMLPMLEFELSRSAIFR